MQKDKMKCKKKNIMWGKILQTCALVIGILCILYFLGILLFTGPGSNFYFIWLIAGIMLVALSLCGKMGILEVVPTWLKYIATFIVLVGLTCFLIVEGMIISGFDEKGEKNLDYIVVLGAQLKPSGPSRVLKMRLDEAYEYLVENPETIVIVSGGQGSNEPDTEAQGMKAYLISKGIDSSRIIKEDQSTNTVENVTYSSKFLDASNDRVGIVTSNFHVFRAIKLAKKAGYQNVCGIASPSYPFLQPNNMVREFVGVVKDFVFGNM